MRSLNKRLLAAAGAVLAILLLQPNPRVMAQAPPLDCGLGSGPICSLQYRCTIYDPQGYCQSVEITQTYYD